MSLSELLTNGKPNGHKVDKVMAVYDLLNDTEREAFHTLIHDPMWSGPQIALTLREMGFNIQGDQIQAFRTKLRTGKVTL
jgi:hypothetical protein